MRRSILATVVTIAFFATACGSSQSDRVTGERPTGPIKVGVVGPMTGQASFVGKNMVEGIQLAVEGINSDGGLFGRTVEYIVRDDEGDPAKTATAVRELIEKEGVVALFGPSGTSNYLSVARIISDEQVPTWSIMAGPELTDDVTPYAFRAYIPDTLEIGALAEFAAARYERIAILAGNEADGQAFSEAMSEALTAEGKPPVTIETFTLDETDYSPIALSVKQSGADAVVLGTHLGLFASRFAVAARNVDYEPQLLGLAGLINYTYPDLARAAADGTIFISFRSWSHLPADEWPTSVRTFYDAYVARYLPDGERSETGAYRAYSTNFLTYDTVKIWAAAAQAAGSPEATDVADELNGGFVYPASESVIGVPWEYSATDHDGIKPGDLAFYRWELGDDGTFTMRLVGSVAEVLSGEARL